MIILIRLMYVLAAYMAVTLACWWVYKRLGLSPEEAILFSLDTIACRGRMSEPVKDGVIIQGIRWWASAQAVFGHLFIPAAISAAFASDFLSWGQATDNDEPDANDSADHDEPSEEESNIRIDRSPTDGARRQIDRSGNDDGENADRDPDTHISTPGSG